MMFNVTLFLFKTLPALVVAGVVSRLHQKKSMDAMAKAIGKETAREVLRLQREERGTVEDDGLVGSLRGNAQVWNS
jgi:hypothetical protein